MSRAELERLPGRAFHFTTAVKLHQCLLIKSLFFFFLLRSSGRETPAVTSEAAADLDYTAEEDYVAVCRGALNVRLQPPPPAAEGDKKSPVNKH